ncbi:asparaginase [Cryptosporangium phraense]|uniref:asparaginase n=1 Tax=Cryptosporangium phraense TaxID=2593070 RepID=UPI001F0F54DC|nr:asparaginase [Cryptosporangium phraense]
MSDTSLPVLARVTRSGIVESRHHGSLVVLDTAGEVHTARGDVTSPVYARSSLKPMQAAAMLESGADLSGELLALAAASHAAEPFHVDGVRAILDRAGLPVDALRCPPGTPLDPVVAEAVLRAGDPTDPRLWMNCSGKHAGFLLACRTSNWATGSYLDVGHPLQARVAAEIAGAAGEPVAHLGIDGCGAPTAALGLTGLARAFGAFVRAEPSSARGRVAAAMRAHPEYVAGTRRPDTWLMRGVPGALAKGGAEGVVAVALADGRALAVKIEDGSQRAVWPVAVAALRALGVDAPVLDRLARAPMLGGGAEVGAVEAVV